MKRTMIAVMAESRISRPNTYPELRNSVAEYPRGHEVHARWGRLDNEHAKHQRFEGGTWRQVALQSDWCSEAHRETMEGEETDKVMGFVGADRSSCIKAPLRCCGRASQRNHESIVKWCVPEPNLDHRIWGSAGPIQSRFAMRIHCTRNMFISCGQELTTACDVKECFDFSRALTLTCVNFPPSPGYHPIPPQSTTQQIVWSFGEIKSAHRL